MAATVSIPTLAGGALKGALRNQAGAAYAALLLHPHPSYGGNMDNPVLMAAEESFSAQGVTTLRFNFNTVGKPGVSDGSSEIQDVQAALHFLTEQTAKEVKLLLFGYSFGCGVGFEFARLYPQRFEAMIAVAPAPQNIHKFSKPLLVIAGARDSVFPHAETKRTIDSLASPSITMKTLPQSDHFFGSTKDMKEIMGVTTEFFKKITGGSTL